MKVCAIVQARLGSERLPGKVLADIHGKPMLQRVVDRVRECDMVDEVVVACPGKDRDRLQHNGAEVSGADDIAEDDVLGRYKRAADIYEAGIIVRITGDCPLVDPALVDEQVRGWLMGGGGYVGPGIYPRGSTGEVFGARALREANRHVGPGGSDREHVTPRIRRCSKRADPKSMLRPGDDRWCVDEQADLDFVRAVYEHLDDPLAGWREVLRVVKEHDLAKINAHVVQKGVG